MAIRGSLGGIGDGLLDSRMKLPWRADSLAFLVPLTGLLLRKLRSLV